MRSLGPRVIKLFPSTGGKGRLMPWRDTPAWIDTETVEWKGVHILNCRRSCMMSGMCCRRADTVDGMKKPCYVCGSRA